jgi:type VI secretion system secreted protein Hcp
MAVDIFLKLGDIKGESADSKHAEEIDVLSWSWGMTQSGSMHVLGGGGSGKVNVQDVSLTKYIDKATPNLMAACCSGEHIPKATLTVRKAGGKEAVEYLIIEMEDVLVASVSTGGSGGEDRLTENIALNFSKFKVKYQPQDQTGAKKGGQITGGWDIAKNTKYA